MTGLKKDAVAAFLAAHPGRPSEPDELGVVEALGEHAPALLPLAIADPTLPRDVLARPLGRGEGPHRLLRVVGAATAGLEDGDELRRVLRRQRHRGIVRIALREALGLADVAETSREMAMLAEALVDAALMAVTRTLVGRFGEPVDASGRRVPFVVLGMGKLGGGELNLGSDVDLCFFYETDEAEVRGSELTVHELYAKIAQRTTSALADVTEDGFCFRVDLRLRPEGSRGPLVNSLASAERYYEAFGRTWERAALLRAAPIAGDRTFGRVLLQALRPFVIRRKVDPGIGREMAELLRRSRRELAVDDARDVKLGRGGIREAEFFVQTLQLVWGGQHESVVVPSTLGALERLRALGLVSPREAETLDAAWAVLRRVEHRIHAFTGYHTHALPTEPEELARFARSLGYADQAGLHAAIDNARAGIAQLFDSLAESEQAPAPELEALAARAAAGAKEAELAPLVRAALPAITDEHEAASHLVRLARRATSPLGQVTFERTPEVALGLLRALREAADVDAALASLADFFGRLSASFPYDRFLLERPRVLLQLVTLFGASRTLSAALVGHPETIDGVLASQGGPTRAGIDAAHAELARADLDSEERVAGLRRLKRETTLQIGLAHVGGTIEPGAVEELLTALAEAQIRVAVEHASRETFASHGVPTSEPSGPAEELLVIGLGKLGGEELGFASDLDLVFLYGADGTVVSPRGREVTHAEIFTRVAQRTMRLLSQPDAEGPGYATDARLRPSGSHGLLVVSLASFDRYHQTHAAAWERQALIRARPLGPATALSAQVAERIARLAYEVGAQPAEDLARMRARIQVELAGENARLYHPKFGYGGLVDVEFVVQWLQMRHGADRTVRSPKTLAALTALERGGYLATADAEALEQGYRFMRSVVQAQRLLDETREPALPVGSAQTAKLAKRLGVHARDGATAEHALAASYIDRAREVRSVFERIVAPVGVAPPWVHERGRR